MTTVTKTSDLFKVPVAIAAPCIAVAVMLALFPQIDIAVSRWFYHPPQGFIYGHNLWVEMLEPLTSLGVLISEGARNMRGAAYMLLYPSLALTALLFALNFLGDGLRDALDPKDR